MCDAEDCAWSLLCVIKVCVTVRAQQLVAPPRCVCVCVFWMPCVCVCCAVQHQAAAVKCVCAALSHCRNNSPFSLSLLHTNTQTRLSFSVNWLSIMIVFLCGCFGGRLLVLISNKHTNCLWMLIINSTESVSPVNDHLNWTSVCQTHSRFSWCPAAPQTLVF